VAKAAGISQAYVYRLFPNKEALFTAVVEHCFVRVRAALEGGAANADSSAPEAVLASMGYEDARGHIVVEGPTVGREGWQRSWNWWVGAADRGAEPSSGSRSRRWTVDLAAPCPRGGTGR
jgi:AcrR family transcriptional regulator